MSNHFHHNKAFGQHFLKSDDTARNIVEALQPLTLANNILEIGPGLGVLTQFLKKIEGKSLFLSEVDKRIIDILINEKGFTREHILEGDIIRIDPTKYIDGPFAIIGNFPYNISSQILFKMIDLKDRIPLLVGMFQKEMAKRVAAKHGNKDYGVITVLVQLYYDCEYLFELPPEAFDPPPKIYSAVIRLIKKTTPVNFDEKLIKTVVKAGFNQRRKKLSNSLLSVHGAKEAAAVLGFSDKRAEQLSVEDFILLANMIQQNLTITE